MVPTRRPHNHHQNLCIRTNECVVRWLWNYRQRQQKNRRTFMKNIAPGSGYSSCFSTLSARVVKRVPLLWAEPRTLVTWKNPILAGGLKCTTERRTSISDGHRCCCISRTGEMVEKRPKKRRRGDNGVPMAGRPAWREKR